MKFFCTLVFLVFVFLPVFASAQVLTGGNGGDNAAVPAKVEQAQPAPRAPRAGAKDPIEITADGSLEWQRNEKKFTARQNAKATQGDTSISTDMLSGYYSENATGTMQMKTLNADGHVKISMKDTHAYGDKAEYDVQNGTAVLTGGDLRLTAPGQVVTARDRFEYDVRGGRLQAIGGAKMEQTDAKGRKQTVTADAFIATLESGGTTGAGGGARDLKTLEGKGNVVITTPTEVIKGGYGIYNAKAKTAELSGGVTITRGENILQGARAQVDLNTNTSRLFGSTQNTGNNTGGGRVRGVFYPE